MQIGAQLWLFRSILDEGEIERVLVQLREAGYVCVETIYGKPPQQRATIDRSGLQCCAALVALSSMPPGQNMASSRRFLKERFGL